MLRERTKRCSKSRSQSSPVGQISRIFAQRWVKYQHSKLLAKLDSTLGKLFLKIGKVYPIKPSKLIALGKI